MAATTREEFRAWLETQPRQVCVAIAYRAAMRVVPFALLIDGSQGAGRIALGTLRAVLWSAVAARRPTSNLSAVAQTVAADAFRFGSDQNEAYRALEAAHAATDAADPTLSPAAAVDAARAASGDATFRARSRFGDPASASDAAYAARTVAYSDMDFSLDRLTNGPVTLPQMVAKTTEPYSMAVQSVLILGKAPDSPWDFWARWYECAMAGDPMPWDLQEQIALIPNEIWEAGPEAVAVRIREIEARFVLKEKLAEAEADLVRSHAQRHGIGGNNPPEAIDDLPEIPKTLELIWEPFAELKEEVAAEEADEGRIQAAISKLTGLLMSCGRWIGGKLDNAATEYARAIGKWGGGATTVWIAAHQPQINAVLVAAKDWLATLIGAV